MKKSLILISFLLSAITFGASVDTSKSKVVWLGKKVTGEHTGTVSVKSGNLEMTEGKLTGGEVVMDMTTITTTDLTGEWATKLVNHLNAEDFFEVKNHKTATFKATSVSGKKGGEYTVKGDLTIKGKSVPHTVKLKQKGNTFTGKLVFNRTKFDIKYGSGSFFKGLGDKMIYDDVELTLTLVAK